MPRHHEQDPEKDNGERWLLTYSDLITLLMVFFVVLYSMSQIDANKFKAVADSLSKALGAEPPQKWISPRTQADLLCLKKETLSLKRHNPEQRIIKTIQPIRIALPMAAKATPIRRI